MGQFSLTLLKTLVPINTGTCELYLVVGTTNSSTVLGSEEKGSTILAIVQAVMAVSVVQCLQIELKLF